MKMYEYQLSRHLAYERRMELLRSVEEARRIAEAEKLLPPERRNLRFSRSIHLLRGLLSDLLGTVSSLSRQIARLI